MKNRVWILGELDPEMEAIERLLREAGERVLYALGKDGARVRADEAYSTAALSRPLPAEAEVYRVECDGPAIPRDARVVDHHRPGDPGYDRHPHDFLPASSIGQVLRELALMGKLPKEWGWWNPIPLSQAGRIWYAGRVEPRVEKRGNGVSEIVYVGPPRWGINAAAGDCALMSYVPRDIVYLAALDHYPEAARRGECLGVDVHDLERWVARSQTLQIG